MWQKCLKYNKSSANLLLQGTVFLAANAQTGSMFPSVPPRPRGSIPINGSRGLCVMS